MDGLSVTVRFAATASRGGAEIAWCGKGMSLVSDLTNAQFCGPSHACQRGMGLGIAALTFCGAMVEMW